MQWKNVQLLLKTATNVFHFTLCIHCFGEHNTYKLLVATKVLKQSEKAIKLIV